jgi:hypothetical protein
MSTASSRAVSNVIPWADAHSSSLTARSSGISASLFIRENIGLATDKGCPMVAICASDFIGNCPDIHSVDSPRQQKHLRDRRFIVNAGLPRRVTGVNGVLPHRGKLCQRKCQREWLDAYCERDDMRRNNNLGTLVLPLHHGTSAPKPISGVIGCKENCLGLQRICQ